MKSWRCEGCLASMVPGEIAIFAEAKRTSYVQAETFTVIHTLTKADLDRTLESFPLVAKDVSEHGAKRLIEQKNRRNNATVTNPPTSDDRGLIAFEENGASSERTPI